MHIAIVYVCIFHPPTPFQVSDYAARNDAILLVIIPAGQAPDILSSRALRLAKEYDTEGFVVPIFFLTGYPVAIFYFDHFTDI